MKTGAHLCWHLVVLVLTVHLLAPVAPAVETPSVEQAIAGNESRIEAVRQSNLEPLDKAALIALLRNRIADLRSGTAKPLAVDPTDGGAFAQPVARTPASPPATPPAAALPGRRVTINGGAPNVPVLLALEARCRTRLNDGDYWYDPVSGACGLWGGPTSGFLPPGLGLGGQLPANASGGNTGVFLNNRELPLMDLLNLNQVLVLVNSRLPAGRWTLDHNGNLGPEGGVALVNLMQIMAAARTAGTWQGGNVGGGGNAAGGDNYWSSRYGAGNEDANGTGYVSIPGGGSVMYGP